MLSRKKAKILAIIGNSPWANCLERYDISETGEQQSKRGREPRVEM